MVDFTNNFRIDNFKVKTVLKADFKLTKNNILEALKHDIIYINGKTYKTPHIELIEALRQKFLYIKEPELIQLYLTEINEKENAST